MIPDLTDLQKEVHALAREKGWYDDRDLSDPDVRDSMLALIHSEVSEALECVRRGEMALEWEQEGPHGPIRWNQTPPQDLVLKPVGFPSELADVVIRCLDFMEAFDVKILRDVVRDVDLSTPTKIAARLNWLHYTLSSYGANCVPVECFDIADVLGFDLLEAIKIKHEYNKTRSRRHGGKAL